MQSPERPLSSIKKITLLITVFMCVVLSILFYKVATADGAGNLAQQRVLTGAIWDINVVKQQLAVLDSSNKDPDGNRRALSNTLTTELAERENPDLRVYQPDSLLRLLEWAEQFQYYSQFDAGSEVFYQSVYQYWFNLVANKLAAFSNEKPSLRYSFKFRYLEARCYEKKFATAPKVPDVDKFIDNILYSHWGHLINATWTQSSFSLKAVGLLGCFLMLYGLYAVVRKLFFLLKKVKQ